MAKEQGTNRGRGGSMHIADPGIGIFGANGIVAAGLPIAVGAATAAQLRADGSVAVAFFGDGAVAQGAFHEAVNLAAVWKLPVVFFCENNGYAEFSPAAAQHAATLEQRAAGYGVGYVAVDGNDVVATATAMEDVVDGVRERRAAGHRRGHDLPLARPLRGRPRALPHGGGGRGVGRPAIPCSCTSGALREAGVEEDAIGSLAASVAQELEDAVEEARRFDVPSSDTALRLRRPAPARAPGTATSGRGRPDLPHDGRGPRRARGRAGSATTGCSSRHRRRRRRQRLRPDPRPPRAVRGPGPRHADLRDRDHGRRGRRRPWPGCTPSSS